MYTFLITLIIITAILLILVVLVQGSKKEGLNSPLGNTGVSQLIGVKKTSDLFEQITWGLIISLFILTLSTATFLGAAGGKQESPNINRVQELDLLPELEQQDVPKEGEEDGERQKNDGN